MIRCLIVDDEPLVRERLRTLLAEHADVQVVGEASDGPAALEAYGEKGPQLVFLDIQMPGLSGLEVAEIWRKDGALPIIIFVTAFDQFALDAFRLHALDYLTKPIDPERFSESLNRARELLHRPNRDELDRRIQAMLEMHERRQSVRPHLVVREHERYLLVPTSEIHCLEATGNYVQLYCERANHPRGGRGEARSPAVPARPPLLDRQPRAGAGSPALDQGRLDSPDAPRPQGPRGPAVPRRADEDPEVGPQAPVTARPLPRILSQLCERSTSAVCSNATGRTSSASPCI
jgi:two-component system LytT family response regulator